MIVVDASAVVAIALNEPEADAIEAVLSRRTELVMIAPTYLECVMVLLGRGRGRAWLEDFIRDNSISLLPLTPAHARLAADAFGRFGRGRGHRARLNFGDCLAYAAAIALDAPLLFKGGDFRLTDVKSALG